jgi:hypothetical protein
VRKFEANSDLRQHAAEKVVSVNSWRLLLGNNISMDRDTYVGKQRDVLHKKTCDETSFKACAYTWSLQLPFHGFFAVRRGNERSCEKLCSPFRTSDFKTCEPALNDLGMGG